MERQRALFGPLNSLSQFMEKKKRKEKETGKGDCAVSLHRGPCLFSLNPERKRRRKGREKKKTYWRSRRVGTIGQSQILSYYSSKKEGRRKKKGNIKEKKRIRMWPNIPLSLLWKRKKKGGGGKKEKKERKDTIKDRVQTFVSKKKRKKKKRKKTKSGGER